MFVPVDFDVPLGLETPQVRLEPLGPEHNDALVLYNAACTFSTIQKKAEALDAISKAWRAGFRDADWARRDTSLSLLHGDPEAEHATVR